MPVTHYPFPISHFPCSASVEFPIISWLREQASESLLHAQQVHEWITASGANPSLAIGLLLDSPKHDTTSILKEPLDTEAKGLGLYRELLEAADGGSVVLDEFARQMIQTEELHAAEVDKMLSNLGDVAAYESGLGEHLSGCR